MMEKSLTPFEVESLRLLALIGQGIGLMVMNRQHSGNLTYEELVVAYGSSLNEAIRSINELIERDSN